MCARVPFAKKCRTNLRIKLFLVLPLRLSGSQNFSNRTLSEGSSVCFLRSLRRIEGHNIFGTEIGLSCPSRAGLPHTPLRPQSLLKGVGGRHRAGGHGPRLVTLLVLDGVVDGVHHAILHHFQLAIRVRFAIAHQLGPHGVADAGIKLAQGIERDHVSDAAGNLHNGLQFAL